MIRRPPSSPLFPSPPLSRSLQPLAGAGGGRGGGQRAHAGRWARGGGGTGGTGGAGSGGGSNWGAGLRGHGRRRFSGRPRLRAGGGGGHHVGVEAEALLTDPDDVGTLQDALPLDALIVDERPVGARVHQQVALSGLDDFRVTARDVLPGSDDVAPRLAPEHHRRARDHILPAVGT